MNEIPFRVRAYGYCELAQLYFPNISKKSASWQLRIWISANEKLNASLVEAGVKPKQKLLTPGQVRLIVEEFGEP